MKELSIAIEDLIKILSGIQKHWYSWKGLLVTIFLIIYLEIEFIYPFIKLPKDYEIQAVFLSILTLSIIWAISKKVPRSKKGKIGFVLCLSYDSENKENQIKEDFILTLKQLVKSGKTGKLFDFLEIPQHIAEKINDPEDAEKLRLKTKAHFLLYGRVRKRSHKGKEHYFINLNGLVSHSPISENISKKLSIEFAELLPRKLLISQEDNLFLFEFTSEWTEIIAKYIIGISAAISGDLNYAEVLYNDVFERTQSSNTNFEIFSKLRERVPLRLCELYVARSEVVYELWTKNPDEKYINQLRQDLNKLDSFQYNNSNVIFIKAICCFLTSRDTKQSINILNSINKQNRNALWHINSAFLCAYEGNLKLAIRHYNKAIEDTTYSDLVTKYPNTLAKIEDFLLMIVNNEPSCYQVYYCLGFFNWKLKGDLKQAKCDFLTFISANNNVSHYKYIKEAELANEWINQIETALAAR